MKILHVITGLDGGGAEAALTRLATADAANHHTVVSLRDRGVYGDALERAGAAVITLGLPRGRVTLAGVRSLRREIRAARPAVVQTWMYHADLVGGIAARLAGVKSVVWGLRGPYERRLTGRATTLVVRACALLSSRLPAAIVANSDFAIQAHRAIGYRNANFIMIPNGYPLDRFAPTEVARAPGAAPSIGMVARWDSHKDHATLFAALALLGADAPQCSLIGAGMEPVNSALTMQLARLGLTDRVRLLGRREDVPAVMAALDLHVLSSAAESFPNVLAEAMASGTPCVSTDVGDARAIVGDTGWLVPPRDPAALAGAIRTALAAMDDREAWQRRRRACRARIEQHYSIERMVARFHEVWHAVAA